MRRFRFTIGSLLGIVLFAAVAFASLREATALWDSVVFTLVSCMLLASVLLAVHRGEKARAFWFGFALFGVAYLAASIIPPVEARLVTSRGLAYLESKIPGRQPVALSGTITGSTVAPGSVATFSFGSSGSTSVSSYNGVINTVQGAPTGRLAWSLSDTSREFVRIGHSFVALLVALAGGWFSRWVHAAGRGRDGAAAPTESEAERTP